MSTAAEAALERLAAYCIDDEPGALQQALQLLADATAGCDVDALMTGLQALRAQRADPERLALAQRQLRAHLGLPMHVGPICRPTRLA